MTVAAGALIGIAITTRSDIPHPHPPRGGRALRGLRATTRTRKEATSVRARQGAQEEATRIRIVSVTIAIAGKAHGQRMIERRTRIGRSIARRRHQDGAMIDLNLGASQSRIVATVDRGAKVRTTSW